MDILTQASQCFISDPRIISGTVSETSGGDPKHRFPFVARVHRISLTRLLSASATSFQALSLAHEVQMGRIPKGICKYSKVGAMGVIEKSRDQQRPS